MTDQIDPENERLISEEITPEPGSFDIGMMSRGQPGLPARFEWRGKQYCVAELLKEWKQTGPCASGADEEYVRKHFYRIRTTTGEAMTLYCTRQPARRGKPKTGRWVLYTMPKSS